MAFPLWRSVALGALTLAIFKAADATTTASSRRTAVGGRERFGGEVLCGTAELAVGDGSCLDNTLNIPVLPDGPACQEDGRAVDLRPVETEPKKRPRALLCRPATSLAVSVAGPTPIVSQGPPNWLAALEPLSIPIRRPERVEKFFRFFTQTAKGRGTVRNWVSRSGRWRGVVERALREHNIPHDLMALVFVESGFDENAESPAGASGLFQLMPATARDAGLTVNPLYDERRSPALAAEAGAAHLAHLMTQLGSWDSVLAAYNLGGGALKRRLTENGTADYWELAQIEGGLPRETALYVPTVLAFALVLNNLDRLGFGDIKPEASLRVSDLDVPAGTSMGLLARASGTSLKKIRAINPQLLTETIPRGGGSYVLHVPSEGWARALVMLPLLSARAGPDPLEDRVPPEFDWGRDDLASALPLLRPPERRTAATRSEADPDLERPRRALAIDREPRPPGKGS